MKGRRCKRRGAERGARWRGQSEPTKVLVRTDCLHHVKSGSMCTHGGPFLLDLANDLLVETLF